MVDVVKKNSDEEVFGPLRREQGSEAAATTLGEDTEFSGTLKFGKTLKILGKFEGDLASEGSLIVGRTGQVKAEIQVGSIVVEGHVTGNITATDLVDLRSTAELYGDIQSAKIKIEEGVVFVGKSDVRPKDKAASSSSSSSDKSASSGSDKKDEKKEDKKAAAS